MQGRNMQSGLGNSPCWLHAQVGGAPVCALGTRCLGRHARRGVAPPRRCQVCAQHPQDLKPAPLPSCPRCHLLHALHMQASPIALHAKLMTKRNMKQQLGVLHSEWRTVISEMAGFYCCMTVTLDLLLSGASTCGGTYGMVSICM